MAPFRLFRLPFLAKKEVVLHLVPLSRYNLYLCSAKTKFQILNLEPNSRTFELFINFDEQFVELKGIGKFHAKQLDLNDVVNDNREFQSQVVPIRQIGEDEFHSFWNVGAIRDGLHTIAMHFIDLLSLKLIKSINIGQGEDDIPSLMWFLNCGAKVQSILFYPFGNRADAVGEIILSDAFLEKVEFNFSLFTPFSTQFEPTQFSGDKTVTITLFLCAGAHWFKRKHLMAMNCSWFLISSCNLTSEDINTYLKTWGPRRKNEERKFQIRLSEECEAFSLEGILEGIADPQNINRTAPGKLSIKFYRGEVEMEIELTNNNRHLEASLQ